MAVSSVVPVCAGCRDCRRPRAACLPAHARALAVRARATWGFPEARVVRLRCAASNAPQHHWPTMARHRASTMSTDDVAAARARAATGPTGSAACSAACESDLYGDTDVRRPHVAPLRAGDVVLTRLEANRPPRHALALRMARATEIGYLKIVAPWNGCAGVEQQGREAWVTPGAVEHLRHHRQPTPSPTPSASST